MMKRLIEGVAALCFPRMCPCCGAVMVRGEETMCLGCRLDLPQTDYHLHADFNPLVERLMCRAPITRAASFFHYERHSPYARLIHEAKYNGRPSIGRLLAREYAAAIYSTGFFDTIDAITPVPLNRLKLIRRGYNQSLHIALGVADVTDLPVVDTLTARRHSTQTRKDARSRFENARGIYSAGAESASGLKHILLVDDIATTGATLCACSEALHAQYPSLQISVLTLAATRRT